MAVRVLRFASLIAFFALQACVCVDTSKVTSFKCGDGDACTEGLRCCGDGVCRADCSAGAGGGTSSAGGGTSSTGGGGSSTGGGTAGSSGGGTSGGSGGGATGCQNNQACTGNTGAPCRTGVTICNGGMASCIDGPAAGNGVACGNNLVCRGGLCVTCSPGTSCTTNTDPCKEGDTTCGAMAGCEDSTRQRPSGAACGVGRVCTSTGQCITCDEGASCSGNPSSPCVAGVVRCASGSATCVDGAPAPSGLACGVDRVCVGGNCLQCVTNAACASNPGAPCRRGVTTCGATPACIDGTNAAAGTACGTDLVCSASGTCVACQAGASCTTNPGSACRRGVVECSTGAPVCVDDALKPAGTSCGMNTVCTAAGTCAACTAGASCTTNPNPGCRNGVTSCATGVQTCADGTPKAAGTTCGMAQVCDANGFCGTCTAGMACTSNPGSPCKTGVIDCSTGSTRCVDSTNVTAGTACGPDQVCNASGSCAACVAGTACTTNPNPSCKTGITSCATGVQTCIDSGNRPPGTTCGTNQVCSVNGNCVSCTAAIACTTNPTPACRNGLTSCATGATTCVNGSNKAAGTACGSGQVCDSNGNCGMCVANQTCTTNPGAPCVAGRTDCSSGSSVCVDNGNVTAGTNCGAGRVCNGSGACIACGAGATCGTNPGACKNGVTDCSTGALRCIDSGNKAPGTTCGSGQVCDASGMCVNCAAGAGCTASNPCFNGSISCTSGSPVCTNASRKGTGASCGTNQVCNALDQCVACTQGAACSTNPGAACRNGTTECSSGAPVCVDGSNKTNGAVCMGGVCNMGMCNACNDGAACTTNTNSACRNGITSCSTGVAVCNDGSSKANGTTCSGGVCNMGSCNPCNSGGACTTNPNPCRTGSTGCTTGVPVCGDGTAKPNGTTCLGGVCNMGNCSACSQGSACTTNPGAACRNGTVDCSTGSSVCLDGTTKPNGTTCTGGVCNGGMCNPCSQGASCTGNPTPACRNGTVECGSGLSVCDDGSAKMDGTVCPGGVCNAGACNPCSAGTACTPTNPCRTGAIGCGTGAPVCGETGSVTVGTACPGGVCNAAGNCVACVAGSACTTNPGYPCQTGAISCGTGAPVCDDDLVSINGTLCPGGKCVTGSCCTGCIRTGVCYPGDERQRCGAGGADCRTCSVSQTCVDAICECTFC
ncbi:MAG: hypothetical protein Q8L14_35945 [Myxococcales bacterium]|nr:hypothetical protein [Myxococcales bacterium]